MVIGRGGRDIPCASALSHVAGYVLALDLTARNLQEEARRKSYPWTIAKGYDTFTPISTFLPASAVPDPRALTFALDVDGQRVQSGFMRDMVFPLPHLLSFISGIMRLEEGDLILTGTPEGVGPIAAGQQLHGVLGLAGGRRLRSMTFTVVHRQYPPS